MSETRPPRPRHGVVGYVAELQQFDPVPTPAGETEARAVQVAPPRSAAPLPSRRPPALSQIRHALGRRSVVIVGAGLAIVVGAGLGFAGLRDSPDATQARVGPTASSAPTDGLLRLEPALPAADPVARRTTAPATPERVGRSSGGRPTDVARVILPGGTGRPSLPGRPGESAASSLVAAFTHVAVPTPEGFIGYVGRVRIDNPGALAADWDVALTVPGGEAVEGIGAAVAQDGEKVTFTPVTGAEVRAGGSVTFTFTVLGALEALPTDCTIDGNPCS